ncbi:hypothetical protein [Streptomyces sp. NPDC014746]
MVRAVGCAEASQNAPHLSLDQTLSAAGWPEAKRPGDRVTG